MEKPSAQLDRPPAPFAVPPAPRPSRPKVKSDANLRHLRAFNKKYHGMADFDTKKAALGEYFYYSLSHCHDYASASRHWRAALPTRLDLFRTGFGRPDLAHSFHQTPCLETCSAHVLQSGMLTPAALLAWSEADPLICHLASSLVAFADYDFRWVREYNTEWASQSEIDPDRQIAYTAALFHYNLDVSLLMRYLGNNFTAEYRDVDAACARLTALGISPDLITKYRRVMLVGCPNHFVAETSRENALLYLRRRNGPTIDRKLDQVRKTMNKEDKNNFVIPLPHWLARFLPHLFLTPQHILEKPGKKDRQIFDGSKRYDENSTSVNMMTSTHLGTEEPCLFGDVRTKIYQRIYNLRVTYGLQEDIIVHANDVKSCFRQVKLHPDNMGAFSYIIAERLFLSCGLPFGTDFSPQNWEPVRQILEILAEKLFADSSLRDRHRQYLSQLVYDQSLGHPQRQPFTMAVPDTLNTGVIVDGQPGPTPHFYYVDDGVYAEIMQRVRVEQAMASSIEAIFVLLGESDLLRRQDPVSFDKLIEMMVGYKNRVLGHIIDTRRMTVGTPEPFLREVLQSLDTTWGPHRRMFQVREAEELTGKLNHIAITAPWLKFLMTQLYQSLSCALRLNEQHARRTCKSFRQSIQALRRLPPGPLKDEARSFHQAEIARAVHRQPKLHCINKTLRKELRLIRRVIADPSLCKASPISHLIPRVPIATAWGDSSLTAAGGFCPTLKFWWYIEWPQAIRSRTLRFVRNNSAGNLIDINVLEYATQIITNVISYLRILELHLLAVDPHPHVLYRGDNTCSESWSLKGAKHSPAGRALGRLQAALMVGNPVHFTAEHVSTEANVVADKISRILSESNLLTAIPLIQRDHPELTGCQRFHLSSSQLSCLTEIILQADCIDPVALSRRLLTAPARTTS